MKLPGGWHPQKGGTLREDETPKGVELPGSLASPDTTKYPYILGGFKNYEKAICLDLVMRMPFGAAFWGCLLKPLKGMPFKAAF